MKRSFYWTYKGLNVYRASINSSGTRWWCRPGNGMALKSGTKAGMRQLITEHLEKT